MPQYTLVLTNVGGASTSGPITFSNTLPAGLTPVLAGGDFGEDGANGSFPCEIDQQTVTCTTAEIVKPGRWISIAILLDVGNLPDPTVLTDSVVVSGGGTAAPVETTTTTTVTSAVPSFEPVPGAAGLSAAVNGVDGTASTQAGSHPYQLTVDLGFPAIKRGTNNIVSIQGGLRDATAALPRGFVVNPNATPVRCTEAQLEANNGCPSDSQVGAVVVSTAAGGIFPHPSPLFNMVPPPGVAAQFGFDALQVGIYVHLDGGIRAGDYALTAIASDVLSRGVNPLLSFQTQLWGDPSDASHDGGVEPQTTPLLSMPTSCSDSLTMEASIASWEQPGIFHQRSALFTDAEGNPTGVDGCDNPELKFAPTLKARPTTNVADSPTGLDVDLHIPQTNDLSELATPHLRKAEVTLPPGLVINPSSANGLAGCSSAQIGISAQTGIADGAPAHCPQASRIGTAEVETALVDHPLPGDVYIATSHDNPFNALFALYIAVEDPKSGVIAKLAGHVLPDPQAGRITAVFDNNPQLPFEDFKLRFFGGPAAPLRTPPTCANYSTTSQMTPWSAPESGPPASPSDTYAITQAPAGGSCAATLPNTPSFDAGSVSLIAGHYSPFVLNLRRNDGTQEFSSITMTPPPGLLGKLAGTPYCSEAALAAAAAKTGNQEKANSSCPSASQVGTVDIGAGAGAAPYYTQGKAYLAGPYKGAPLSLAIITPATAGPYDLGTVVVKSALKVDPETARITAVSDPIPQILQGVPLDVRSIALKLDKPNFTLNPTSCNPFAISGQLLSTQGQAAALQNPFQVAECGFLGFKPKLSLKLKGGTRRSDHPALKATLTMPPGGANIAKASVALPHSEFLDQAHIRTVCTRVQFAASACPPASVYGKATAFTPLLDAPLQGPVYLRSSNNPLPDLVADLNGQIPVVLVGRIDSVKGGIRSSFEAVPDAPVSKFILEMKGGRKGLLVNSRNLCKSVNRATVLFDAQNGKIADSRPELKNDCKAKGKKAKKQKKKRG